MSFGFGFWKCSVGGKTPSRTTCAAWISPVTPAAISRCPTLLLAVPTAQNCFAFVWARNALVSADISIGSPSGVPVPCASTYPMESGETPGQGLRHRNNVCLPLDTRRGIANLIGAVVIGRKAADHCVDRVAVGHRIFETLQDNHSGAGAKHCAIGIFIECAAMTVGRSHPAFLIEVSTFLRERNGNPTRQSHVALVGLQSLCRLADSKQQRRASGDHREGRTLQIQFVGNASCKEINIATQSHRIIGNLVSADIVLDEATVTANMAQK